MYRVFFGFFLVSFYLFAENFETNFQATVEAEPSVILENCINLITGQLYINDADIIAEGKEPIYYSKSYTSIFSEPSLDYLISRWEEFDDLIDAGWGGDKHEMAFIGYDNERHKDEVKRVNRRVEIYEPHGVMLSFEFPEVKHPKNKFWDSKKGQSPAPKGTGLNS